MKRYVNKYEIWRKSPGLNESDSNRPSTEEIEMNRKKQDVEVRNRQESDKIWVSDHPIEGVTINGKPLVAEKSFYYDNPDGTWEWSVEFNNGDKYINVYTDKSNPRQMIFRTGLTYGVEGKEELISWCHRNMMYHGVPSLKRESILKRMQEEIK